MNREEQRRQLEETYLNAFLGFAIKKMNNYDEAEELAQEIRWRRRLSMEFGADTNRT